MTKNKTIAHNRKLKFHELESILKEYTFIESFRDYDENRLCQEFTIRIDKTILDKDLWEKFLEENDGTIIAYY